MSNALSQKRQIAVLGQLIILVFLASVFFRVRVVESVHFAEDFQNISALASFADSPVHRILSDSYDSIDVFQRTFDLNIQREVISWLEQNHNDVDRSRRKLREFVVQWLKGHGLEATYLESLSGKGRGDELPALFFRSSVPLFESPLKVEANIAKKNPPIELLLKELQHLFALTNIEIATQLREPNLPAPDIKLDENWLEPGTYDLRFIFLDDSSELVLSFLENVGIAQRSGDHQIIRIPVKIETKNVNILELLMEGRGRRRFELLLSNKAVFQRLLRTYGPLRLKAGEEISGERMLDNYHDVEMLGFKFSPMYFWIFIFAFQLVFLFASSVHIRSPSKQEEQETTTFGLNLFLERGIVRIVLWFVLPMSSLLLAFPQQYWSMTAGFVYAVAVAILGVVGLWLCLLAKHTRSSS